MVRFLLDKFELFIRSQGSSAAQKDECILTKDDRFILRYIPFEHVNEGARLVIVGITPGPNQMELAYDQTQNLLQAGRSHADILREVKKIAGFGGATMRPNLLRMLRHFGFRDLLRIDKEEDLWGSKANLLHSTSVVPHAAFRRDGKPFSGSFAEILSSSAMRDSFEQDFVTSLTKLQPDALFVALGPTPLEALKWCTRNGFIREQQIVGAFAHPATTAGSQVAIYLRERRFEDLSHRDPVRHRNDWLSAAYDEVNRSLHRLRAESLIVTPQAPKIEEMEAFPSISVTVSPRATIVVQTDSPCRLRYIVKRGKGAGTVLTPHRHEDGKFVVSLTRFEADYVRLASLEAVMEWVHKGYSVRMSNPGSSTHRVPSLISPTSIRCL